MHLISSRGLGEKSGIILIGLLFLLAGFPALAMSESNKDASVSVDVSGFRNNNGQACATIFIEKTGFPEENKGLKKLRSQIVNNSVRFVFEGLKVGTYAISVYHDENDNGKIDVKYFDIPIEGYGFSNNHKPVFGPPNYKKAKFHVKSGNNRQTIKMVY